MSAPQPAIEGAEAAQDAASAWQKVHADPTIQYAPIDLTTKPPEPPGWLQALEKFLRAIFEPIGQALGVSWPVLQWVLLALVALFVLYALWRFTETMRLGWKRKDAEAPEAEWRPDQAEALALLEDADRLAAEGKFDEATHLLLRRSVQQIQAARPDWVRRASTAREIAGIAALPDKARGAFGTIAARVERSLFALRQLDAGDWQAARSAYAEFALERLAQ
ncbi:MAG: hypothetical protein KGZ65_01430 [Sphingomonadales bacterium]|nr:hypothetical protein [Sphingomonadaceae bacterium]MBS3929866.1 hypothetical protein [Sphingomonadales bacterium]